jgi:uncharacterized membrane protein YraQ (UPF0718 family)
MDGLLQIAIIIGMFILRLGIPLIITLLVGYWLHRLDNKWQAEARTQPETEANQVQEKQAPEPKPTVLRTKHP